MCADSETVTSIDVQVVDYRVETESLYDQTYYSLSTLGQGKGGQCTTVWLDALKGDYFQRVRTGFRGGLLSYLEI